MDQYTEPADDFAQIGEEPAKAESSKSQGKINEFDGTYHHANGARYFPDGRKVDGANNWVLAQEEPAKTVAPATPAAPAAPGNNTNLNPFDGTEHKNGTRYFPDGKVVGGVNLNLGQAVPAELKVPAKGDAKGPTSPINEFDGTVHKDGKRYFPDGKIVDGVNLWLTQNSTAKAEEKGPTSPIN